MATELDKDNLINAMKGEEVIRPCVTCKHYRSKWIENDRCVRALKLKYHPITGKKSWMGKSCTCASARCMDDVSHEMNPCGEYGKYWEKKEIFWRRWLK